MPVPAQNQQYENFIIRYKQNTHGGFDYESDENFQIVNDLFGILYVPMQKVPELELSSYSYSSIPRCYTYMDTGALSTSGVTGLHNHPYLKLQGKGTLVAVIVPESIIFIRHFIMACKVRFLVSGIKHWKAEQMAEFRLAESSADNRSNRL